MRKAKDVLYALGQCTWGVLQTLLGLTVFLCNLRAPHRLFRGVIVTEWSNASSVSLGLFVFVTASRIFMTS